MGHGSAEFRAFGIVGWAQRGDGFACGLQGHVVAALQLGFDLDSRRRRGRPGCTRSSASSTSHLGRARPGRGCVRSVSVSRYGSGQRQAAAGQRVADVLGQRRRAALPGGLRAVRRAPVPAACPRSSCSSISVARRHATQMRSPSALRVHVASAWPWIVRRRKPTCAGQSARGGVEKALRCSSRRRPATRTRRSCRPRPGGPAALVSRPQLQLALESSFIPSSAPTPPPPARPRPSR